MVKESHATETQAFAARLRRALEDSGIQPSPTVVANAFNLRYWGRSITPHTARNWLLGNAIPTQDKLRVLADWLQVPPDVLRFGDTHAAGQVAESRSPYASTLDGQDQDMLRRFLSLSAEDRQLVRRMVQALAGLRDGR
ncbi:hypothetical protein CCO03_00935 [Comamonas serinivorans]|uniref:Transcriptional regulator n=1 Tax=Comamonas serinivorans TaxID=1082851 RepID=A0A1Y0EII9_9BURK|nr:hypothetical protein [Comamonas serinivorans]ARU03435.1 hypothetical protein CCO03_00935 [Comamonas serinivorans]